jgi:hypothetical protein
VFLDRSEGRPTFDVALSDGTKAVKIEVYALELAKHLTARVTLVTDRGSRPEQTSPLELELSIEAARLERLANAFQNVKRIGDHPLSAVGALSAPSTSS